MPELLFGITQLNVLHNDFEPAPDIDTTFRMVREASVFDYLDKTPPEEDLPAYLKASEKYGVPVLAGGWFYTIGRDEALIERNLRLAQALGSRVHNVQVLADHAAGRPVTDDEVAEWYLRARDIGLPLGVEPCFEVHVNMWSEDFRRVERVAKLVEARGVPFRMTLDHSHVIFKIDNPAEQEIGDIRGDVEAGRLVLDPRKPGAVTDRWIEAGYVRHAHARAAVPSNPRNSFHRYDDGRPGRGIQYPWLRPAPGAWFDAWDESLLEPWKEVVRRLFRYHATHPESPLGQVSTEFISRPDYGAGCRYSMFEQGVACAGWLRALWRDSLAAANATPKPEPMGAKA
ncbi:MAG: hypothetical protein AB7P52_02260 [Alphaproteobacteria bacterium]